MAEADEGLRSLEDLLNIAGIKLTTTLDSDQVLDIDHRSEGLTFTKKSLKVASNPMYNSVQC